MENLAASLREFVALLMGVDINRVSVTVETRPIEGSDLKALMVDVRMDGEEVPEHVGDAVLELLGAANKIADLKREAEAEGVGVVLSPDRGLN